MRIWLPISVAVADLQKSRIKGYETRPKSPKSVQKVPKIAYIARLASLER
jgi:hypothetical protein